MKDIASFFVSLFQELKLPVRWLALAFLIAVILAGIFGYEQLTGNFYLAKLERKITLLKELQTIADAGVDKHPELESIYERTSSELANFEVRPASSYISSIKIGDPTNLGKAVSGALLWIIVLIFGVSSEYQKNGKLTGMIIGLGIFLLVIAIFFAWIGTLIPTLYNPWVNYILFPIVQLGIVLLFTPKKKKV